MSYQIITDPKFPGQFRVVSGWRLYTSYMYVYMYIYTSILSLCVVGRSMDDAGLVCRRA